MSTSSDEKDLYKIYKNNWNTIKYAKKVGKDIEIIDLQKL